MIHTTHIKAIEAYNSINVLCEAKMNLLDSLKIEEMRIALKKIADIHDEEITRMLNHHAEKHDGFFVFPSPEAEAAYNEECAKMGENKVNVLADPVVIEFAKYNTNSIYISPNDIRNLRGFVDFFWDDFKSESTQDDSEEEK